MSTCFKNLESALVKQIYVRLRVNISAFALQDIIFGEIQTDTHIFLSDMSKGGSLPEIVLTQGHILPDTMCVTPPGGLFVC